MKTKLTDEQLHDVVYGWVKKLCETGGRAWTLRIPADHDRDPDLLITELINRHKALLQPAPPSSPTATTEEILKKHFDEDWPEDMGVRGTAEEWEAFKESQPVFIKSMLATMHEYASLKEQEAHNRAVQECILMLEVYGLGQAVEVLKAKLKVEGK